MLDAEHAAGLEPALLSYAHGGFDLRPPWAHHRIADWVKDRSLRSGPSWRKVVQDGQLAVAVRRMQRSLRPAGMVAHHVEAAAAALASRSPDVIFFAHTALGPELPTYFSPAWSSVTERLAVAIDVGLARRAWKVAAVSPWLADYFSRAAGRDVAYVPVPWSLPTPIEADERTKARARFGFDALEPVIVYAGNLDAYQGIDSMAEAFVAVLRRRPDARLLVATASDPKPLEKQLWPSGAARRTRFVSLQDEPDRRAAHAAADVAWVPRASPGGLPMKLLDALARAVPTVTSRRACAGLELESVATVVGDDDPEALAAGALLAIEGRAAARERAQRGRAYIGEAHAGDAYVRAMDALQTSRA